VAASGPPPKHFQASEPQIKFARNPLPHPRFPANSITSIRRFQIPNQWLGNSSRTTKYSPDLNPIEQFFAKFKHWLRKAAQRTTDAVYDAIAPILETVSPAECANYFTNAGYNQT
jgi:hypothetical protein